MAHSTTLRAAAQQCEITLHTSFRWRHRFLEVLENDQGQQLGDIVELDETFFRESFKGQRSGLPRAARRRGNEKKAECRSKRSNCEETPPICPEALLTDFSQSGLSNSGESVHQFVGRGGR